MNYLKEYEKWCTDPMFDEATRAELKGLTDEKEIEDRFYKQLSFGTGGLRGVIGAGTNRMNVYTVGKATQGLANFINSQTKCGSVVIAYDSRKMSPEFALGAALVLAANGIKAHLFESLRPTPELSFSVRELKATAGIVITASHNPPQYNGYKVYWSDGGQIVPPYDKLIISEVNKITDYSQIKRIDEKSATESGLLKFVGKELDDKYIACVKNTVLNPEAIKAVSGDMKIVYTPLNGTGLMPVTRVLDELGFKNVSVVKEQAAPDGNFPTLKYPNPEDPEAFSLALKLAKEDDADIVLATDPDADRLGVYAKDADGSYMSFTGNMSGLLIAEYELSQRKRKNMLPENGALVTTVVSSDMAFEIAKEYGVEVIEVLTGFKYIGEQIKLFEERGKNGEKHNSFLFGFEESYGCLVGTYARDKDAVVAVTKLCEAAAYYRTNGLTLCDQMRNIYKKYGYFKEALKSVTLTGADGAAAIAQIMERLRFNPPSELGGKKVLAVRDYKAGVRRALESGAEQKLTLPESNVLYFEMSGGWCCVRPSGTEPKIKFYFGVKAADADSAERGIASLRESLLKLAAAE